MPRPLRYEGGVSLLGMLTMLQELDGGQEAAQSLSLEDKAWGRGSLMARGTPESRGCFQANSGSGSVV